MALTERERQFLDERADELAAELACTDPDLVHALTHALARRPPPLRVVINVLLVLSLPLAVVGIGMLEPIAYAAACVLILAASVIALCDFVRRRFGTGL